MRIRRAPIAGANAPIDSTSTRVASTRLSPDLLLASVPALRGDRFSGE
jgi:hypothetical protein